MIFDFLSMHLPLITSVFWPLNIIFLLKPGENSSTKREQPSSNKNRCLHHYIYSTDPSNKILDYNCISFW